MDRSPWVSEPQTIALVTNESLRLDRYLVPFSFRHVPLYRFDVLVVGSGVGGGAAALAAADAGASVAVITKADLSETNTYYAQGGMAAVLSTPPDSHEAHVADTLAVGCGLCDHDAVDIVVRDGPDAVKRLLAMGAELDRHANGDLVLSREGGHSHARIVHAQGDATGVEIQRSISTVLREHPSITTFSEMFAIDLLEDPSGRVSGLVAVNSRGDRVGFVASQVILATGGGGQIYRETTNPVIATGDGVALGLRAGAIVRDLEFVQFHPTCLYIAGAARVLISEIVRGHGGILRDKNGVRFMPEYHPSAELAPRDVVSRAVSARMLATHDTSAYLDLSGIAEDPHTLFPGISRICHFFGIDIAKDPVPVRPGAHYMVGGLKVDLDGRTNVPGLWAVGECASSGLHGANRMGSNSLLEGLVMGLRAGRIAGRETHVSSARDLIAREPNDLPKAPPGVRVNLQDIIYALKSLMWRQMGVERTRAGIEDALEKIRFWSRAVAALGPAEPRALELVNMLTVAHVATLGALSREESRGTHFRTDHPSTKESWRRHTLVTPVRDGDRIVRLDLSNEPVRDAQPVNA